MRRKVLLACGAVASLLYLGMNVFVPMQWDAYSSFSQTISELSAVDAPTRPLWFPLGTIYTLLVAAFGVGVWQSAERSRSLRVVGGLLIGNGLIGLGWLPMHQRTVLAAGGATFTDTVHIVWSVITVTLMMLEIGFAAAAFGAHRFRVEPSVGLNRRAPAPRGHVLISRKSPASRPSPSNPRARPDVRQPCSWRSSRSRS